MGKDFTSIKFWIIIIFLVVLVFSGLQIFSQELLQNNDADLDDDSVIYLATINGVDMTKYQDKTSLDIETNELELNADNETGDALKDNALEFLYSKTQSNKVTTFIKNIYNIPSYIIILFGIPMEGVNWIVNIIAWFLFFILIAVGYYFIKGR